MSQQIGRLLLIQVGNGAVPEVFSNMCGITTRSFNMSTSEVDTTIPDCNNPGGPLVRTAEPGTQNRTFSGSGKFVSGANAKTLLDHVRAGSTFSAKVIVPGDGVYTGTWFVSEFEFSGEAEGNMDFSATFVAASPPVFAAEGGAPSNTLLPAISGIAQVGKVLAAWPGEWTNSPVFTYQWKAEGVDIPGATGSTYTVLVGDLGDNISVTVTATTSSGNASATSAATDEVIAA
jgi:predicted secreted protein